MILTWKDCVLLSPVKEFIEMKLGYFRHFSYVNKIISLKE